MSNIVHVKGDLFTAPKGSTLIHACNTKGVWGSGIAKQFKEKFPYAYSFYKRMCDYEKEALLGLCILIPDGDYTIACLFTSKDYGANVDPVEDILKATETAIQHLVRLNAGLNELHTCKINSGLFKVPWELTEKILQDSGEKFTVYEP